MTAVAREEPDKWIWGQSRILVYPKRTGEPCTIYGFSHSAVCVEEDGSWRFDGGMKWGKHAPFRSSMAAFSCHCAFTSALPDALFLLLTLADPTPYSRAPHTSSFWVSASFLALLAYGHRNPTSHAELRQAETAGPLFSHPDFEFECISP